MTVSSRKHIAILGIDCDGVLTDYKCYFDEKGKQFKVFNSHDSYAIKNLKKIGVIPVIVTSDINNIKPVEARAKSWGVEVFGATNKKKIIKDLMTKYGLPSYFVGNGPEDESVLDVVEKLFLTADARPEIKSIDNPKIAILKKNGGDGVLDEVFEELKVEIS